MRGFDAFNAMQEILKKHDASKGLQDDIAIWTAHYITPVDTLIKIDSGATAHDSKVDVRGASKQIDAAIKENMLAAIRDRAKISLTTKDGIHTYQVTVVLFDKDQRPPHFTGVVAPKSSNAPKIGHGTQQELPGNWAHALPSGDIVP